MYYMGSRLPREESLLRGDMCRNLGGVDLRGVDLEMSHCLFSDGVSLSVGAHSSSLSRIVAQQSFAHTREQ